MRIFGIGIDVVEVARIAQAIDRQGDRFIQKIFTPAEQAYCKLQKKPALHYAVRFAAKEAASKALGTGIGAHAGWLELEVTRQESGAPALSLHGTAAAFASRNCITDLQISLTHASDYAAANAIAISMSPQS
jgi:holo-[acyl-carrier protein] synthase